MRYRWTITFEAESDDEAYAQTEEALPAFESVHGETIVQLDDDAEPEPPSIACCESAIATGGAYHAPICLEGAS